MKKKMEDERDEERIHRQLKEINEESFKEKQSRASFKRNQSPINSINTPRKPNNLEVLAGNHLVPQRENMKSQVDIRADNYNSNMDTSFDSNMQHQHINNGSFLNPQRLRSERDAYEG